MTISKNTVNTSSGSDKDNLKKIVSDKTLSDYTLKLGKDEYAPIMQGGMGVDISTSALALAVARMGGIGHISDAMAPFVSDRKFRTKFQSTKQKLYSEFSDSLDKSKVKWDFESRTFYNGCQEGVRWGFC